jgi:hypothetical protein
VPGAGGTTGSTRAMRARPDGYTILMGHAGTHACCRNSRDARDGWSDTGSPGSRATSFHTCQVLRPRRVIQALAVTRLSESPSTFAMVSAPGI